MIRRELYPIGTWLSWTIVWPLVLIAAGFALFATTDAETLYLDGGQWWWLGGAGPAAGLLYLYGTTRRRRAMARFTSGELAPLLAARVSPARQAFRAGLLVTAALLIGAGVIGPRWGIYLESQKVHGVDIVVALDVSRSMLARDVEPDRLARAKREIRQQLTERAVFRHANRMALLAFAGSTSLKLPLTTDHAAFRNKLDAITIGSAPRGGTAIAEAIRAATDLCAGSPEEATKIILVFTDGEDHEGDPDAAAAEALEAYGIQTYVIGVGDPALSTGAQIPIIENGVTKPLLYNGQIVFSKLDVQGMTRIALAGNGRYAPIVQFSRLIDAIASVRNTHMTTEDRIRHKPRYQWLVAGALILLLLESMISERRSSIAIAPQRVWQQEATG